MQEKSPLISVVMNCYNGEKFLNEAINSVLNQTYSNWELIFWDNQSNDNSANIFNGYNDRRLKYFYAPKYTLLYEARNYAINEANGEFYAFLDVDDWWESTKLEKQLMLFTDKEIGFVYGNYWMADEEVGKRYIKYKKNSLPIGNITSSIAKFYCVGLLTLMVRKSSYSSLETGFNSAYHIIGDFDLVLRLSTSFKAGCIQEPIANYRWHGMNESSKGRDIEIEEMDNWVETACMDQRLKKYTDIIRGVRNYKQARNLIVNGFKFKGLMCLFRVNQFSLKAKIIFLAFSP